jgi:hypothetical protein
MVMVRWREKYEDWSCRLQLFVYVYLYLTFDSSSLMFLFPTPIASSTFESDAEINLSVPLDIEADVMMPDGEGQAKNRKNRPTGSTHFGDTDVFEENAYEMADATCSEVCRTCCVHSPKE